MTVLVVVAAPSTAPEADAQDQAAEWLFVQNAESVTLKDGVLTLHNISPTTLFFSDRPERIAAHGLTAEFVTFWQQTADDGFGADPPNAVLALVTQGATDDIVLTLMDPELDGSTLTYAVTVLEGRSRRCRWLGRRDGWNAAPCGVWSTIEWRVQ
jgi:hypothetical protein